MLQFFCMKHLLRTQLRAARKNQPLLIKKIKDKKICSKLEKIEDFRSAKSVLFYAPIEKEREIDIWELIKKYIQKKQTLLPKTEQKKRSIKICLIEKISDLQKQNFHIHEPQKHCKKFDIKKIDLIIVPGIGFDKKGNRIGFGHGYYDRLLKKTKCPVVGLAYEFQIVQTITGEKHDVKINKIITEKRIIICH